MKLKDLQVGHQFRVNSPFEGGTIIWRKIEPISKTMNGKTNVYNVVEVATNEKYVMPLDEEVIPVD